MIVKRLQNDQNQNVLLIVHDERGQADRIIASLYTLLKDLVIYHQSGETPTHDLTHRYFHAFDEDFESQIRDALYPPSDQQDIPATTETNGIPPE